MGINFYSQDQNLKAKAEKVLSQVEVASFPFELKIGLDYSSSKNKYCENDWSFVFTDTPDSIIHRPDHLFVLLLDDWATFEQLLPRICNYEIGQREDIIKSRLRESDQKVLMITKKLTENISELTASSRFMNDLLKYMKLKSEILIEEKENLAPAMIQKMSSLNIAAEPLKKVDVLQKDNLLLHFFSDFVEVAVPVGREYLVCFFVDLLNTIERKLFWRESRETDRGEATIWEEVFLKLDMPVAVLSGEGDLILHNSPFSRLKILHLNLLDIPDGDEIEIDRVIYKVIRSNIHQSDNRTFHYFIFQSDQNLPRNLKEGTFSDLGIISGSIAHELNNPLSGILAAVDLLKLDAEEGSELEASLDDMRTSVIRSKQLVEIFLGFSQESPSAAAVGDVYEAFEQAHKLIRFRSVEAGFYFELNQNKQLDKFAKMINPSIMSMIFYLILNEVMTSYAHSGLIEEQQRLNNVVIDFYEFEDRVKLSIGVRNGSAVRVSMSKLMEHLLKLEKLDLRQNENEISLISEGFL